MLAWRWCLSCLSSPTFLFYEWRWNPKRVNFAVKGNFFCDFRLRLGGMRRLLFLFFGAASCIFQPQLCSVAASAVSISAIYGAVSVFCFLHAVCLLSAGFDSVFLGGL